MARTAQQVIEAIIGSTIVQVATLQSQVETLTEQIAELEKKIEKLEKKQK